MRRRTRSRYYTIDAENEEEFIKEYENMRKSRLTELEFDDKEENEKIQETDEEDQLSPRKNRGSINYNNLEEDGEYSGLGAMKDLDDEEDDDLGQQYEDDEILKKSEDDIIKDNNEEKGLEILCYYLKNSVNEQSKGKISNNSDSIFYRNKNCIRTDFILQNIESDSNLKIMIMSNNKSTKNSFINKFFSQKNEFSNKEKSNEENLDDPFVIRKKQIKLFNKNISLQIFDTSDEFHKNPTSFVYYKLVSAFFIFIEASSHNSKTYLEFIYSRLNKFISNKTFVIFGINMLFKEDCTIDGFNLREYANEKNMMFIPIKINELDLKNSLVVNLFNLILIKGIDNKNSKDSLRKESKDLKLGGYKTKLALKINDSSKKKNIYDITKMNIPSCLGYKKKYRIRHINIFDIDDNFSQRYKRKLSVDI